MGCRMRPANRADLPLALKGRGSKVRVLIQRAIRSRAINILGADRFNYGRNLVIAPEPWQSKFSAS